MHIENCIFIASKAINVHLEIRISLIISGVLGFTGKWQLFVLSCTCENAEFSN